MSLTSFWHKQIYNSKPWVEVVIVDGAPTVKDYNPAFIESLIKKAGLLALGRSNEDLIKFFLDPDFFEKEALAAEQEQQRLADLEEPKIELGLENGKMVVKSYNKKFVDEQRRILGELTANKTDEEVVTLFIDRENIDREEPRLDVLHLGIEEDGRIKMKLDWNRAFITHLKAHGITGETDDEAIQSYLQMMTVNELQGDNVEPNEFFTKDQIETAFEQMDREMLDELEEARKQIEATKSKARREKRRAARKES